MIRFDSLLVNAGMNGIAQGLGKLVRFVVTSIALVKFGAASWGEVAFALTLVTYLNFVLDFGLSSLALIEHPDDEKLDRKLFVALGYTRGLLILGMALVGLIPFVLMDFPGGIVLKVYLLQVFLRPANLDWWLSRKGFAGINPVVQLARQVLVLAAMWVLNLASIEQFAILDVGSEVVATAALWILGPKRKFSVGVPSLLEWKGAWSCYRGSLILFASSSLLLLHQNVDIFFLKFFEGNAAVGVYDYCYRYALFVFVLGGSLSVPLRRQLARLREFGNGKESAELVFSCHKILGVMSAGFLWLSLSFAGLFFAKVVPIDTDFPATRLVVLFACWLVISFYSIPWSEWLISESRKGYLVLAIVAGTVNVVSNVLLIPRYGILGAALAKICSEGGIFLFLMFRISPLLRRDFYRVIGIHIVLIPSLVVFLVCGEAPVWLLGVSAGLILVVLFFFKYLSPKDFLVLKRN